MSQRGQGMCWGRLHLRKKVNFSFFGDNKTLSVHRLYIESGCLEQLKVDVAAWAGHVLGTAPFEEEG